MPGQITPCSIPAGSTAGLLTAAVIALPFLLPGTVSGQRAATELRGRPKQSQGPAAGRQAAAGPTHSVYNLVPGHGPGRLNLRSGPGRRHRRVGRISHGDRLRVLHGRRRWRRVTVISGALRGRSGWANARWLRPLRLVPARRRPRRSSLAATDGGARGEAAGSGSCRPHARRCSPTAPRWTDLGPVGWDRRSWGNGRCRSAGQWRRGREHGVHREWYSNGCPKSACTYRNGRKHGPCRTWYRSGRLMSSFRYHAGRPKGSWTIRHEDGRRWLAFAHDRRGRRVNGR